MSLDLEHRLCVFLASAPQRIYSIATIELRHSAMSRVFRLWREPRAGQIGTEAGMAPVEPVNLEIKLPSSVGNLDQRFDIAIDTTDITDQFRAEIDRIPLGTKEKVQAVYREYLSDDLSAVQTSARLQVESVSYQRGLATITAVSPRLNITRTGELYTPRDVPMLRGFL